MDIQISTVTGEDLERVLDWTYPIWNEGLTRPAYSRWNRGQLGTEWAKQNLSRVVLDTESGRVASAKRYDLRARVNGVPSDILGIGAVFTPAEERGRGHARRLLGAMCADAEQRGCRYALLFSEIGATFYERLGFVVVPQRMATIEVVPGPRGAPAVLVRSADSRDLANIAEIAARDAGRAGLTLERSPELIAFGVTRKRLLAGLGPAGLRSLEFFVTEEGCNAVAYVILTNGPKGWLLEDCGDRDPSGARVGAMLQVLAARTPAEQPMRFRTLLPIPALPPQVRVLSEDPVNEVMMIKPLGTGSGQIPSDTLYCHLDVF